MSGYAGDIRLGDTHDFKFTTRQISGAPSTLSSSPVISAYPGNSTTELTAGITLTVDFDSRTGYNNIRVVATSGNGYATATNYDLAITTGTVNSVSVVGESVASFSIENRSALMPATAARTLVVDASGLADANMVKMGPSGSGTAQTARDIGASVLLSSGTGTGQVSLSSGAVIVQSGTGTGQISLSSGLVSLSGTQTFNVTGNITGNLSGSVGSVTGAVGSVTGNVGGNVTGSVGSVVGAVGSVTGSVTVGTNNDKTGYALTAAYDAAKTASQAGDAMTLTSGERNSVADALLARNIAGGSSSGRLISDAFAFLRNKWVVSAGTLTVYASDDSTPLWTATISSDAAALPVVGSDPA